VSTSPTEDSYAESGSESGSDPESESAIESLLGTRYAWGYDEAREQLRTLYRRAVRSQWDADEVLPWDTPVDPEAHRWPEHLSPLHGSDIHDSLSPEKRGQLMDEISAWTLSQLLHGEQGGLLSTAQLVHIAHDLDSKLFAAIQVSDEARHVDVFRRYLRQVHGFSYPINPHLRTLLDMTLKDSRWDIKFLGTQIMVEGLALAGVSMIRHTTTEPLLRELTTYVVQDEARHLSFGLLELRGYYDDMAERDRREREDFLYEAATLMRDRFLFREVWEKQGLPVEQCIEFAMHNHTQILFRRNVFGRVVPALRKIGLLSPRLRERLRGLGIL